MKITNFKVYDLYESVVASGFPMLDKYKHLEFEDAVEKCRDQALTPTIIKEDPNWNRAFKLCNTSIGSGHDNFLSGILVSMNVTATVKWWTQMQRYHFVQIVSSMSTMHRLRSMLQKCVFSFPTQEDGFLGMVEAFEDVMNKSNNECVSDVELAYRCPMALELTARITTNYRQLRTIYLQRKNHKLPEWSVFCSWIEELPFATDLILSGVLMKEGANYWNEEIRARDAKIKNQHDVIQKYKSTVSLLNQKLKDIAEKYNGMNSNKNDPFKKILEAVLKQKLKGSLKKK